MSLAGIWYLDCAGDARRGYEGRHLVPGGTNFALGHGAMENAKNPAASYNVYSTPTPGEYIFQSQYNGMYVGMPAGSGLVCASFSSPAQAQPLIPTPYHGWGGEGGDAIILYLPDGVQYLGQRDDGMWTWQTDKGGIGYLFWHGALIPTSWSFSDILAGKGTGGFTLNYAKLTYQEFPPHTDLRGIDFSGAVLDGATLDWCDLTEAKFGATLDWRDPTEPKFTNYCSLKRAHLNYAILVGAVFDEANLTGAQLFQPKWNDVKAVGAILDEAAFTAATLTPAFMPRASLKKTFFVNSTINGGDFSNCDLTSVGSDPTVVSTQSQPVLFNGAKLNFSLIGHNWEWMDLRNATVYRLPEPLSSSTTQLKATGAKLSGLNQGSLKGVTLEHAVLDYSLLDGLDLSGADLTGASLIDASLHGATLTNTKLPGANLSGSQLGKLGHLFTLPSSAQAAHAGQVSVLAPFFKQNGITLSSNATIQTLATNRVWQLNDAGNHVAYTIRLQTQSGNRQVLTVYAPVLPASLVNAYLPNATLTGANLYGAPANGIQFYGSNARIDGSAILEGAQLNNSNLCNLNLTQAELLGANLSGSYLFNAKFNKANLTPSPVFGAANLSDANLQGADFTDAQLYGANLSNAAVAVKVPTRAVPNQGGVYLFSLPYADGDTNTLQQYTGELNAAASEFSLNPDGDQAKLQQYVSALKANDLAPLKPAFLKHQPPIILSDNAQIQTVEVGDIWQIVDGAQSYTLWTDPDENGNTELYAAPSLTKTQAAFNHKNMTLRWQASAAVDTAGQQWLLDNDSENPQNFSTGYVKFIVQLNGSVLDVYGTAVRIERLGDNNQLQMDTETCNVTVIAVTNMNSDTICPNGTALGVNQKTGGVQWDTKWLRATAPPKPPTCVPTDYSWCPQTQTTNRP